MRKITMVLGAAALVAFASCKKEEKEINVDGTTVDTTIVVHETEPAPAPDTVVVAPAESDGTSVNVNSDGVHVDTKSGDKKTTINMSKDGAGVEVKK